MSEPKHLQGVPRNELVARIVELEYRISTTVEANDQIARALIGRPIGDLVADMRAAAIEAFKLVAAAADAMHDRDDALRKVFDLENQLERTRMLLDGARTQCERIRQWYFQLQKEKQG